MAKERQPFCPFDFRIKMLKSDIRFFKHHAEALQKDFPALVVKNKIESMEKTIVFTEQAKKECCERGIMRSCKK